MKHLFPLLLCLCLAVACSKKKPEPSTTPESSTTMEPSTTMETQEATPATPIENPMKVTAKDFGDDWPFKAASGELGCDGSAVTFTTKGKTYAVNGAAKGLKKWPAMDAIWKDDPTNPGAKVNVQPVIEKGLSLCK